MWQYCSEGDRFKDGRAVVIWLSCRVHLKTFFRHYKVDWVKFNYNQLTSVVRPHSRIRFYREQRIDAVRWSNIIVCTSPGEYELSPDIERRLQCGRSLLRRRLCRRNLLHGKSSSAMTIAVTDMARRDTFLTIDQRDQYFAKSHDRTWSIFSHHGISADRMTLASRHRVSCWVGASLRLYSRLQFPSNERIKTSLTLLIFCTLYSRYMYVAD